MKIVGCDLHAKQQTIAMVDTETGEFTEKTLSHEGNEVREFYAALEGPVVVGIEATGAMQWFLELLAQFKRPYRNCPDHTNLGIPHFCFGAVPIGIYRLSGAILEALFQVIAKSKEQDKV
jgi:hypothetical protein